VKAKAKPGSGSADLVEIGKGGVGVGQEAAMGGPEASQQVSGSESKMSRRRWWLRGRPSRRIGQQQRRMHPHPQQKQQQHRMAILASWSSGACPLFRKRIRCARSAGTLSMSSGKECVWFPKQLPRGGAKSAIPGRHSCSTSWASDRLRNSRSWTRKRNTCSGERPPRKSTA
jgi:hypothetical protein